MTSLADCPQAQPTVTAQMQVLHPGDVAVGCRGDRMETLLGSCIALILTNPGRTVGAMCHIVHSGGASTLDADDTAHAEPALRSMFRLLKQAGVDPGLCGAYVYGGGNMFPSLFTNTHVGEKNAEWVFSALDHHHILLIEHDVGGATYRRVRWTVGTVAPQVEAIPV